MTECQNPNCPIHGKSPEAVQRREIHARIVSNPEFMDVIRVLAANADSQLINDAGYNGHPMAVEVQMKVLQGEFDAHPVVQGLIHGFIMLLGSNRPTQEFFNLCREVPEDQTFINIQRREAEKAASEQPPRPMIFTGTIEDLIALLRGRMG